jgi:molybdenum cofactor sulfurtransferase
MLKNAKEMFAPVKEYRSVELPELANTAYLDYMGSGLAANAVRTSNAKLLCNPHSLHALGHAAAVEARTARCLTEQFFKSTLEYDLIFTSGCTSSLNTVATHLPFGSSGCVLMHPLAHNSLLGIREFVAPHCYHCINDAKTAASIIDRAASSSDVNVICVPAECNLSGARLDIATFTEAAKCNPSKEVFVVVDGAAISGKAPIALDGSGIDFFAFSFYKIFGAPTGLGGLFVKKGRPQEVLRANKRYFGGGTVSFNLHSKVGGHQLHTSFSAAMEDGTANFYGIAQVPQGFRCVQKLGGVVAINQRIQLLRAYCIESLQALHHRNGSPLVRIYTIPTTDVAIQSWGSSVAFSVMEHDGTFVGHYLAERLLAGLKVYVRGGCMCNPGACATFIGYDGDLMDEARNAGHTCGDEMDLLDGKPLGCLRVSLGSTSIPEDVDRLISALVRCFRRDDNIPMAKSATATSALRLRRITVYPVKGMGGVSVDSWPLRSSGLAFDRMWMLVDCTSGAPVAPKTFSVMAAFEVALDWPRNVLTVRFADKEAVHIVVDESRRCEVRGALRSAAAASQTVKLKNRTLPTYRTYDVAADQWFSSVVGIPVRLARNMCSADETLSNSAALLVIHEDSHHRVLRHMNAVDRPFVSLASYRPNIVVAGAAPFYSGAVRRKGETPFEENTWTTLSIDGVQLVAVGPCKRCQQVNVGTGELRHEPLASISSLCRLGGLSEVLFGQLFNVAIISAAAADTAPSAALPWAAAFAALAVACALRVSPLTVPVLACVKYCDGVARRPQQLAGVHGVLLNVGARVEVG